MYTYWLTKCELGKVGSLTLTAKTLNKIARTASLHIDAVLYSRK